MCLDPAFWDGARDRNVQLYFCDQINDQQFYISDRLRNGEWFSLVNKKSHMCLDVAGYNGELEANV